MKSVLFFVFIFSAFFAIAQEPEPIYGKNRVLHPNEYYLQQMELWNEVIADNSRDANAWYNYYRASRNAYIVGEENDSLNTKGINRFSRLNNIVTQMERYVPESYEYHFVKWLNGNNDISLLPHLEKAHELAPQKSEPIMSLMYCAEISGDYAKRTEYATAFCKLEDYSAGLLRFAHNMIIGLDSNSIIFTEGDKDTDGILLLQYGLDIRTDLRMLNLNLLLIPEYRMRVFNELGIEQLGFDPLSTDENYERYRSAIIQHCLKNKNNRAVAVAITVSDPYKKNSSNELYLTGLSYQYSTIPLDTISILVKNYEWLFMTRTLADTSVNDISQGWLNQFNQHYLPTIAILHNHFKISGDTGEALYYLELAKKIASNAGSDEEFLKYFAKE